MSAESGISTFRDADGLWEKYPVMQVCSADGFAADPALVHRFYNDRRSQLDEVQPCEGHRAIARLERYSTSTSSHRTSTTSTSAQEAHACTISTASCAKSAPSTTKTSSTRSPPAASPPPTHASTATPCGPTSCSSRKPCPRSDPATKIVAQADVFVIIGTTLSVYPAAALLRYVRPGTPVYYIDPHPAQVPDGVHIIRAGASEGMAALTRILLGAEQN